jgi:phage-related protein
VADEIDEAYVEIKPDVKGFRSELQTDLDAAFAGVERKLDRVVDSIEHQFDRLIDQLDLNFHQLASTVRDASDEMQFQVRETGADIGSYIEAGAEVAKHAIDDLADSADHDFNRIKRHARSAGEETGTSFIGGLLSKFRNLGKDLEGAAGTAQGASGQGGGIFSGLLGALGGGGDITSLLKVGVIAALIPIVLSLAAALSQLAGLLLLIPGLIGVAVAAIAPMIIAFKGLGEAIGAGLSGDTEKFNEALKKLAPSARTVVKEIVGMKDLFSQIKRQVQEAFFKPLIGDFANIHKFLGPTLIGGLSGVAAALGRFAHGLLDLLSQKDIITDINKLFGATGRIIDKFAPVASRLFGTLFGVMEHSLPFVERMFDALNGGLTKFTDYLQRAMKSGDFEGFLEDAFRVAGELGDLLKSVGGLLGTLFGNADQQAAGEDIIKSLQKMIDKLNEFFKSAKGQETLKALAETAKFLGRSLIQTAEILAFFLSAVNTLVHGLIDAWNWLKKAGVAVGEFFAAVGSAIGSGFMAVVHFFSDLGEMARGWASSFFGFLKDAFVSGWHRVTDTVSTFVSTIVGLFTDFPAKLKFYFEEAFRAIFFAVGFGIGFIIGLFETLPTKVGNFVSAMWNFVTSAFHAGVDAVIGFFKAIPDVASSVWESIRSSVVSAAKATWHGVVSFIGAIPDAIADFFSSAWHKAVSLAESLRSGVVAKISALVSGAKAEASKLSGQIASAFSSAIGKAEQIGRDIISGMINGIRRKAGDLINAAKNAVIDGLNAAKRALGANSPSKEYAKLGADTVRGYNVGQDQEMQKNDPFKLMPRDAFARSSATAQSQLTPSLHVGGAQIVAYLQIGDDQLHPVVIKAIEQNPQAVSLAVENGDSQLARRR